jgi:hypothetical protein
MNKKERRRNPHLISNITDNYISQMLCDAFLAQSILFFTKLSNAPPQNTIDVIFLLLICKTWTTPSWGRSCYFFSVDKIQGLNIPAAR